MVISLFMTVKPFCRKVPITFMALLCFCNQGAVWAWTRIFYPLSKIGKQGLVYGYTRLATCSCFPEQHKKCSIYTFSNYRITVFFIKDGRMYIVKFLSINVYCIIIGFHNLRTLFCKSKLKI